MALNWIYCVSSAVGNLIKASVDAHPPLGVKSEWGQIRAGIQQCGQKFIISPGKARQAGEVP